MEKNENMWSSPVPAPAFGYEAAKAFATRGRNLIVVPRRKDRLEHLKEEWTEIDPALDVVVKTCDLLVLPDAHQTL